MIETMPHSEIVSEIRSMIEDFPGQVSDGSYPYWMWQVKLGQLLESLTKMEPSKNWDSVMDQVADITLLESNRLYTIIDLIEGTLLKPLDCEEKVTTQDGKLIGTCRDDQSDMYVSVEFPDGKAHHVHRSSLRSLEV